jgi:cytochrome c biogenesis protein CcdA
VSLWFTFVEGFEAAAQPCTLPLLIIALVFVLTAGRAAPLAVAALVAGLSLMAWTRFARIVTVDVIGLTAVVMGASVAAAALVVAAKRNTSRLAVAVGSGIGGAVAAAAWRPCVGPRLAEIINDAPDSPLSTLPPTIAYVLGIAAIPAAIAALPLAIPRTARFFERPYVVGTGVALAIALGALMAVGVWDSVVEELLVRSTA